MAERPDRAFFTRPSHVVAHDMIGMILVGTEANPVGGRIVECEAYGDASDLASHSAVYPKARAHLLAGRPGTLYVYRSYGIHHCMNVLAHEEGTAGAVLIRALEPLFGVDLIRARRGDHAEHRLLAGPGNVCQGLGIAMIDNGRDLLDESLLIATLPGPAQPVAQSARIGITRDVERPWRFIDPTSKSLSGPKLPYRASI
ncbi:MAG TPA: DNA-3-methyladenine glycosylase [Thermomicrobiales bacterium]|nr:DNA-3-methyladenine glycosylase [Thermomicrobiales bacterium]